MIEELRLLWWAVGRFALLCLIVFVLTVGAFELAMLIGILTNTKPL